jgi:hypothetical protein
MVNNNADDTDYADEHRFFYPRQNSVIRTEVEQNKLSAQNRVISVICVLKLESDKLEGKKER